MHKYGDCSFCGGEVQEEIVELDYRYKEKLYVFRDVPAGVCRQCGERYLMARTAKTIEREMTIESAQREMIAVPVIPFPESIAA